MRLAILTQYYPPETGAPQARLSHLARRFVERGHDVFVVTAMPNYPQGVIYPGYGRWYRREERDGVTVIRSFVYPTKRAALVPRLTNYFSFVASSVVAGVATLPRVDYLITESPPLFLGISGYVLSRLKGARLIFNVSDLWPDSVARLKVVTRESTAYRLAEALEAFCYRKAWLVSGQSREIVEYVRQRFPGVATYHLSNGVDPERFRPPVSGRTQHRLLDDGTACVAVYAGLHGIPQGLDQVLEAATRLPDGGDLRIVFVGDGPEKARLVERAHALQLTNVRFLDPIPQEAMPEMLAAADVALVPLKQWIPGSVPSKLYEAMGSGLPVVLIAEGEAADIVHETKAGVVVAPGDIDGLARQLQALAADAPRRAEMGRRGREAALTRFNRRIILDAFIDHLEQAA